MARMLNGMRNFEGARVQLERAVKENPSLAEARNMLGTVYERAGRLDEACEQYRHAVRLDPNIPQAQLNLGAYLPGQATAPERASTCSVRLKAAMPPYGNSLFKFLLTFKANNSRWHNIRMRTILLGLIVTTAAWASESALVQRKTNLRKDPSTKQTPISVLLPNDELQLLDDASSDRYLKVRMEDGKTGWVWRKAVTTLPDASNVPLPKPFAVQAAISPDWAKPVPVDVAFEGSEGTCGPNGDGGDRATNLRKNRTDRLTEVHDVPVSAIAGLSYPTAPTQRSKWSKQQLAQIAPFEGVMLRTVGYLSHPSKSEVDGSGESTNCHFHNEEDVDWHIYLQENAADGIDRALIVETTPRVRQQLSWNLTLLQTYVGSGKPVRISGFLMLDPEHQNQVGKYRGTVWELHPVMKIEVCPAASCQEQQWADLLSAQ